MNTPRMTHWPNSSHAPYRSVSVADVSSPSRMAWVKIRATMEYSKAWESVKRLTRARVSMLSGWESISMGPSVAQAYPRAPERARRGAQAGGSARMAVRTSRGSMRKR